MGRRFSALTGFLARWPQLVAMLVVFSISPGCTSLTSEAGSGGGDAVFTTSLPEPTVPGQTNPGVPQVGAAGLQDPAATLVAAQVAEQDYRIGSLDVLDISVFGVPDLTKTVRVSATGQIVLPLIGAVDARGRTTRELEAELAAKLGDKYLQSPDVTVAVKEATSQRVTVSGAVKQPGVFPLTGRTTLLQTIALAGGLDPVADPRSVVVFRYSGGQRMAARFDVAAIGSGNLPDPPVTGGDVVMVDQSGTRATLRDITQNLPILSFFMPLLLL